jgi:hypothetical protein
VQDSCRNHRSERGDDVPLQTTTPTVRSCVHHARVIPDRSGTDLILDSFFPSDPRLFAGGLTPSPSWRPRTAALPDPTTSPPCSVTSSLALTNAAANVSWVFVTRLYLAFVTKHNRVSTVLSFAGKIESETDEPHTANLCLGSGKFSAGRG